MCYTHRLRRRGMRGAHYGYTHSYRMRTGCTYYHKCAAHFIKNRLRRLIDAIRAPHMSCNILVAHAPCMKDSTPGTLERIKVWWRTTTQLMLQHKGGAEAFITCIDANARLGSVTSTAVGDVCAEQQKEAGARFHDFLQETDQWAPSTFCLRSQVVCQHGQHQARVRSTSIAWTMWQFQIPSGSANKGLMITSTLLLLTKIIELWAPVYTLRVITLRHLPIKDTRSPRSK